MKDTFVFLASSSSLGGVAGFLTREDLLRPEASSESNNSCFIVSKTGLIGSAISGLGKVFFLPTGVLGIFTGWGRLSFSMAVFFCASSFQRFQISASQTEIKLKKLF